jgi:hypothetical protein
MSVEEMVEICKSFPEWMRKNIIIKPSTAVQPLVDSLQNLIAQIKEVRKGAFRVAILNTDFFPKTEAGEAAKKEITDYLKSLTPESAPHISNPLMESSFSKLKMLGIDPGDAFKIIDGRSCSEAETASLLNTCEKLVSEIQKNISVSVGKNAVAPALKTLQDLEREGHIKIIDCNVPDVPESVQYRPYERIGGSTTTYSDKGNPGMTVRMMLKILGFMDKNGKLHEPPVLTKADLMAMADRQKKGRIFYSKSDFFEPPK